MRLPAVLLAAALLVGCTTAPSDAVTAPTVTIVNSIDGQPVPKVDTAGQPLDAHEGTIVHANGLYWMIGNTYGCGYQWIKVASPWCGFRTYSSPDLVTWTNHGATFSPDHSYWQTLCRPLGCFNARLIYDPRGQWRLWFNAYNARSGYQVLSATTPAGPWRRMYDPNLAVGNNNPGRGNGAGSLYYDKATGKGYLAYTAWTLGGKAVVEELRPDMITGTGRYSIVSNVVSAEAPSLFKGPDGTFFVTYNAPGCAWCGGTGTSYATAPSPMGPWVRRGSISARSCNGQAASQVATLPGGLTLFISDQWTNLVEPRPADWNGMTDLLTIGDYNQTEATQHWEPLKLNPGTRGMGWITPSPITCSASVTVPIN